MIVIGTGAVGVVLGGALAKGAWNVTMVDVNEAKLEAGRRDGIEVNGIRQRNLSFTSFAQWTQPDDARTFTLVGSVKSNAEEPFFRQFSSI